MLSDEAFLLALHKGFEAGTIDGGHGGSEEGLRFYEEEKVYAEGNRRRKGAKPKEPSTTKDTKEY
jgi:hypothetical protein